MKINYNVLWVEDYPKDMKVQIDRIKKILESNYYIIKGHDHPFTSYGEFIDYVNKKSANDFSKIDLILIDYNLSDKAGKTGIDIIQLLRNKDIYTDVIFYSGNMKDAIKQIKSYSDEFDNVTYSDNTMLELIPKFKKILNKQLNLVMQIPDIRGYLMDATSDFDFMTRSFVDRYFNKLSAEDKAFVYNEIRERVGAQKKRESNKFNKFESGPNDNDLVNAAMDSLEYVMTVKDKIYIMALIKQKIDAADDNYASSFAKDYESKVIKYRNKLAHNKLVYGTKQAGHIKVISSIDKIDCDCSQCKEKLTIVECDELRKNLFEYYLFFRNLIPQLNED